MTTAVLEPRNHQFDVEDIEYLRHGDKPLLARVFRPRGEGPFPALVECHGGAWCLGATIRRWQQGQRRQPFPSCSRAAPTPLRSVSLPASSGRAATEQG